MGRDKKSTSAILPATTGAPRANVPQSAAAETTELLHELQVHQVQLEMQNESLREMQQALEESRDRYLDLFERAPVGYLIVNLDGVITEVNLTGAALLARERTKLRNKKFISLVVPADKARWARQFVQLTSGAISEGAQIDVELTLLRGDGTELAAQLVCERKKAKRAGVPNHGVDKVLAEQAGSAVTAARLAALDAAGFRIALSDVGERQRVASALRLGRESLRGILETTLDGYWSIDPQGRFLDVNRTYCEQSGYSRDELLGMRVQDVESVETPEETAAHMKRLIEVGRSQFETVQRRKDGSLWQVEVSATAKDGMIFTFLRDISARKEAEAELLRSNRELEQFSYSISHDMRQPLRMIASYLKLLEMGLVEQLDSEQRSYFNFAIDGAKRLDLMLQGLLDYSRVGRKGEPPAWIDSRALLDEVLLFLQPAIAEAQAEIRIEGEWPRVFASPDELLRLIQNLVTNALKFRVTGRTPELVVSSGVLPGTGAAQAKVSHGETARNWRLGVADNGIGVLPDQSGRLFQVFQRLQSRAVYEGTGIGLALCRKIAEHHGGRIWVESAGEGQGSTFWLELPLPQEGSG